MKKLLTILVVLTALLFTSGLIACSDKKETKENTKATEQYKVYQTYVAYAESSNTVPLSYEQWLQNIKGEKGDTGVGISEIKKSASVDDIDTYIIVFTDGSTYSFEISNIHEHKYSTEWTHDRSYHYYGATCSHKNETKNKEEHVFGTDNTCKTCGYKLPFTNGLSYKLINSDKEYEITGILYNSYDVIIPAYYKGLPVTRIGKSAFSSNYIIKRIELPDTITCIESYAFASCHNLSYIKFSKNITNIEDNAFYCCEVLGYYADYSPITLPDKLANIGAYAFWNCGIRTLTIPKNVLSIGVDAFSACFNLKELIVADENNRYTSINNCLIDTTTNSLIAGCKTSVIPKGVQNISANAFRACKYLTNIELPNSIKNIEKDAFDSCEDLLKIKIPNSMTRLNDSVFSFCEKLKEIEIPVSIRYLGSNLLSNCKNLELITYEGTIQQWNDIEKGYGWDGQTGNYTIHCSDGDIVKS